MYALLDDHQISIRWNSLEFTRTQHNRGDRPLERSTGSGALAVWAAICMQIAAAISLIGFLLLEKFAFPNLNNLKRFALFILGSGELPVRRGRLSRRICQVASGSRSTLPPDYPPEPVLSTRLDSWSVGYFNSVLRTY